MSSFNDISGTPVVISHYLLTGVLRNKWGFTGPVVSDWCSISQLEAQGFSSDPGKQAAAALKAGNDIDMLSKAYKTIPQLLESGEITMQDLDIAVGRVLRLKFECGLFENPYTEELSPAEFLFKPEAMDTALEAAEKAVVLLKNNNKILPLQDKYSRLAVIGPLANNKKALIGGWMNLIDEIETTTPTIIDKMREIFSSSDVVYAQGCSELDYPSSSPGSALASSRDAARPTLESSSHSSSFFVL